MRRINQQKLKYKGCFVVDCEVTARSRRGGLCMLWGETMNMQLLSFSMNHVVYKVEDETNGNDWYCSGIYGWPQKEC